MPVFALSIWPIATLALFAALGPVRGLIWAVMVGYLFLPDSFQMDVPGLPPINKASTISLSLLLAAIVFRANIAEIPRPPLVNTGFRALLMTFIVLMFVIPLATILTNSNTLVNGPPANLAIRPALSFRDLIAMTFETLAVFVPFLLAMRLLGTGEQHREVLRVLIILGLLYSLLVLFEARMSPQLNNWVYGYFPHNWIQHIRGGAFRPVVFLRHGLWVGLFLFMVILACFAMARQATGAQRTGYLLAGMWMLAVLALSRNTGALMLSVLFAPLVLFAPRALLTKTAVVFAVIFVAYPAIRQSGYLPLSDTVDYLAQYIPARAQSLGYRFNMEDLLLARALEQPWFGWGGWSRWMVVDDATGEVITVPDGLWIIVLGERGWLGYVAYFGPMILPLLYFGLGWRGRSIPVVTAGMVIIMTGNLIYLVPNSALSPIGMLVFGALAGFALSGATVPSAPTAPEPAGGTGRVPLRYTRFGPGAERAPLTRRQRPQKARVSSR